MYERILVPLDGSPASESVLAPVRWLGHRASSEILLAQVVEPNPQDVGPGFQQESQEFARDYLNQAAEALEGLRVQIRVRPGPVVDALVALAREEPVKLIAMATHGRTSSPQVPYGGVTEGLIRSSPVPLLALPSLSYQARTRGEDLRAMLVTTDGSPASRAIVPHAIQLAVLAGANVFLLHVASTRPAWLNEVLEPFQRGGVQVKTIIEPGDPVRTILDVTAREHIDLIALSTHGKSKTAGQATGGVTRALLRQSPVPLLVARG